MINVTEELRSQFALSGITLIHESTSDSNTKFPCVTYYENNNTDEAVGDNMGYSRVSYMINVWSYKMSELIDLCCKVDKAMKRLKFIRKADNEQNVGGLYRKILNYERLIKENYEMEEL